MLGPALERHRLRCRFRPRGRKKACAECSRSKVRCDQGVPTCSRCTVHALFCTYPQAERTGPVATRLDPDEQGLHPTVPFPQTPSSDLSHPDWGSGIDGQVPLIDPGTSFQSAGWVPDAQAWQAEAPSFFDAAYCNNTDSQGPADIFNSDNTQVTEAANFPTESAFQALSGYLAATWTPTEQGLDRIDRVCKGFVDIFAGGPGRAPFIHFRDWEPATRSMALTEAAAIAPLYPTATPQASSLLLRAIDAQLLPVQLKVSFDSLVSTNLLATQSTYTPGSRSRRNPGKTTSPQRKPSSSTLPCECTAPAPPHQSA
jgi:hypothetical protein